MYSFSNILKDIHNKYNIVLGKCISDYTYDELRIIEKDLLEWHNDNTNAVVLKKEVHYLFHSIYSMRGNTAEQFQEFKEKYKQGFFNIER